MKTNPNEPINAVVNAEGFCTSIENILDEDAGVIGLTKREYFAAMAMQGIISGLPNDKIMLMKQLEYYIKQYGNEPMANSIAKESIIMADALINELNK
jgi:hypothetical protein